MQTSAKIGGVLGAVRERAAQLLRDEGGQGATEYALVTFFGLVGASAGLLVFLPNAIKSYEIYIKGFYLVLGLPVP